MPKISVIMPVHNNEDHIDSSVRSILEQKFSDFEFIIIDDASNMRTSSKLQAWATNDSRIRLFRNTTNKGITRSLNIGLSKANGEYIARQDSDDISLPDRLGKQIAYMEANKSIGILSGGYRDIDSDGRPLAEHTPPQTNHLIAWNLCTGANAIVHPLVMIRASILQTIGPYDETYECSQDYELWCRAIGTTRFANLSSILLARRVHDGQISVRKRQEQYFNTLKSLKKTCEHHLQTALRLDQVKGLVSFHNYFDGCSTDYLKEAIPIQILTLRALSGLYALSTNEEVEIMNIMAERIATYPAQLKTRSALSGRELLAELWNRVKARFTSN